MKEKISEVIKGINLSEEKTMIKILIVILILVFAYYHIIEPMLTRKHCSDIARREAIFNSSCSKYYDYDYDIDYINCIIDKYESFYNFCLEYK